MRDFEKWFENFTDNIYTYKYFTDFDKVYKNIDNIKIELNILNSLIGNSNIEDDFKNLIKKYPQVLKCIPILLAIRQKDISLNDYTGSKQIDFTLFKYSDIEIYTKFMSETGLFNLLASSKIKCLVDYVTGIEVGLDCNARKNRTGIIMENIIENYIQQAGYIENKTYYKQVATNSFNMLFNIKLPTFELSHADKKFDFVIKNTNNKIFAIEVNFYNSKGSKLNETARSYKEIAFEFIWITDGSGWKYAKKNLADTFHNMEHIYNLKDVENGLFTNLI